MATKQHVLFVCLGNICRSPAAEAVMKSLVERRGQGQDFYIDSCGTGDWHVGEPADARMRKHGKARGYAVDSIARHLGSKDYRDFDYVVTMDDENFRTVTARAPRDRSAQIVRMTDFHPDSQINAVPDPYYGGAQGFEEVLDILEQSCEGFLAHLEGS